MPASRKLPEGETPAPRVRFIGDAGDVLRTRGFPLPHHGAPVHTPLTKCRAARARGGNFMTTDLTYLALTAMLTAALWIPYISCQVITNGLLRPAIYTDPAARPVPLWGKRADRAYMNAVETFAPFAALVLVAHVAGKANGMTAFFAASFFWLRADPRHRLSCRHPLHPHRRLHARLPLRCRDLLAGDQLAHALIACRSASFAAPIAPARARPRRAARRRTGSGS